MFHKIYNLVSAILFVVFGIVLFFSDNLNPKYYFIGVAIYAFLYLLINAIRKEKLKTLFLMPLIGALTSFGLLNLTIMATAEATNFISKHDTISYVQAIKSTASSYKELFEYDDLLFYVDRDFENLIELSKTDDSYIVAYPIKNGKEVSDDLSIFSPFYDIASVKDVQKTCSYNLHYAFIKNAHDSSILLRIVDEENVYYTYIIPNDLIKFASNSQAFEYLTNEGSLYIYVSNTSASADLNDVNSNKTEIDAVRNEPMILTINGNSYYCGSAMYVEYENAPDFVSRINSFYNREILEQIEAKRKELETASEEDAEILNDEILNLSMSVRNYYVELINEKINDEFSLRLYRTYSPTLTSDETQETTEPDFDVISAIEWEVNGTYLIGNTDFASNYMISEELYEK